ncbi:MAG TPA: efflux RND transporter periplasmic adaptor subunit, partial [Oscillatoriales cyanobacterium M59_W2019_021]|nr:efflux RND transporter periplasmic adaptor subunit [Oscillatoriales cyanobacterium M59_W2019_021]
MGQKLERLVLISLLVLTVPELAQAHGGHSQEFEASESVSPTGIAVDAQTAQRMGIRVEPATRELMQTGIQATGKIETMPGNTVEVTSPIPGKIVELLVEPGDEVAKGQAVAVLSSPELAELGVNAQEKRAEAEADVLEAEAQLQLARDNFDRLSNIADAEITQAQTQLQVARERYNRDRSLVEKGGVVAATRESYRRQLEVAAAEIAQAETERAVAQERYDKDRELVEGGALPRREMLESEARLADANAALTRAKGRLSVIEAETAVRQAEMDLPTRDLRESEDLLAQAQAQLTAANQRREVGEAQAEIQKAEAALQVAQARLQLSDGTYAARLRQVGAVANPDGTVTIVAPIGGTVSDRTITLGESVEASGEPLMHILDNTLVWATANIYEKDIDRIQEGQSVIVRVNGLDRTFSGTIDRISPTVDEERRVIQVRAALENDRELLKPGMFANLEIATSRSSEPVLSIPMSALVEANGQQLVYVENGQNFEPVEVELGEKFGDRVQVKSGLFEGDRIVTQGGMLLYAQSLRGGGQKHDSKPEETITTSPSFPIWMWVPIGGAIAALGG